MSKATNRLRKVLVVLLILSLVALIISYIGYTEMWFYKTQSSSGIVYSGSVNIELLAGGDTLALDENSQTLPFTIKSGSTVDSFVRIGYALVAEDSSGKQIPFPASEIGASVSLVGLKIDNAPANIIDLASSELSDTGNMLELVQTTGGKLSYITIPSKAEIITGSVEVTWDANGIKAILPEGASVSLVLVPEATQATGMALENLRDYGWNPDLCPVAN